MNFLTTHLKKLDWILIGSTILLVSIGLVSIYSSSRGDFLNFKKQLVFSFVGLFLMILISFLDWRALRENPYLILTLYSLCCLSLAGLFFFAPQIRGVRSWYKIGPFSIDPIEPTKLVLIILLAKYFSERHVEMYRIHHILISALYIFIPSFLTFFQPDLGSVLILISLWIAILIISGIKLKHFFLLCLTFFLIFILSWSFFLKDYQKKRILSFLNPHLEPLGTGWSQKQAQIAIGTGGIFGKGFKKGSQTQYGFLPVPQTDFIFSAIAEEMGLFGIAITLSLFFILIFRIIKIAFEKKGNFPRLFATGLTAFLISQIFVHCGMNLGILPIIGISLPFVSFGVSSLITLFSVLGILLSIMIH